MTEQKKTKTREIADRQAERYSQEVERGESEVDVNDRKTRTEAAVTMKFFGANYTTIAKELGYADATRARQAVEKALSSMANSPDKVEHVRTILDKRLERLFASVSRRAFDSKDPEQLAYHRAALSVVDRQARLHGVDAPQQTIIHTPDSGRVEKWIAEITALAGADTGEADILDAEVLDDNDVEPEIEG